MSMNDRYAFLADETVRKVFTEVLHEGRVRIGELKLIVGGKTDVHNAVEKLSVLHLVNTTPAPISEFKTVYPTSEGLTLARKLNIDSLPMMKRAAR